MQELLEEPRFWVAVAFVMFLTAFGKKIWKAIAGGLDNRSARICAELDEARKLREEAQFVLDAYRKKNAESMKEAEAILAQARQDADALVAHANEELKRLLEARARMAEEKIAQAEKQAVTEVREHVIDITISAAKAIIIENIQQTPNDELLRRAIMDIERKVH